MPGSPNNSFEENNEMLRGCCGGNDNAKSTAFVEEEELCVAMGLGYKNI
jgi:hypothetical protein